MSSEKIFCVNSSDELLSELKKLKVPLIGHRRDKSKNPPVNRKRENYVISNYLKILNANNLLSFPLSFFRESPPLPDFKVNNTLIEITESTDVGIDENYVWNCSGNNDLVNISNIVTEIFIKKIKKISKESENSELLIYTNSKYDSVMDYADTSRVEMLKEKILKGIEEYQFNHKNINVSFLSAGGELLIRNLPKDPKIIRMIS